MDPSQSKIIDTARRSIMKTLIIAALLISSLYLVNGSLAATNPTLSDSSTPANEVDKFGERWRDPRNLKLVQDATADLRANARDSQAAAVILDSLTAFQEAMQKYKDGDHSPLAQLGGLKGYKVIVAGWLNDRDPAARGLAAVWLGISGDRTYATNLWKLLKDKAEPDAEHLRADRGRAALALGLMGAKQYTQQLVALLNSPNEFDRGGAAYGLGYLKAKKYETVIGRLLYDKNESVRTAAEEALGLMDADR